MVDLIKKAGLVTAELISLTSEKVQEVADDFVKKGTLHDNDARKFVAEVRTKMESREKELGEKWQQISNNMNQIGNTLGIAKMGEDNLDRRIDELERQLEDLKARRDSAKKNDKKAPVAAHSHSAAASDKK